MNVAALAARLNALETEQHALRAELETSRRERDQYRALYLKSQEALARLQAGLRAHPSEKRKSDEQQLSLSILAELLGQPEPDPGTELPPEPDQADKPVTPRPSTSRRNGRTRPVETLPRIPVEVLPPEVLREGLDAFVRIGEDSSETLKYRSASVVVVRTIRPKFVRKGAVASAPESSVVELPEGNELPTVLVADPPQLPIPRSKAGPGLLAQTLVMRWQDHLPLHRQSAIFARHGAPLARSTLCDWHLQAAELVEPLYAAMWEDARGQPYLCTDATGVLVQAKEKCRRTHFWVVVAPERHVLFRHSNKHNSAAVDVMFRDYAGYLVADAHSVYDHLYRDGDIVEVGCWAHARRYFFKTLDSEPERAREALALIGKLLEVERAIADTPRKSRERKRKKLSARIVEQFFTWCATYAPTALEDSPLDRAITYATNQEQALKRFLADGRLPLHNRGSAPMGHAPPPAATTG